MRSFFHCRTGRMRRRGTAAIVLAASFCAETALIAFFVFFLTLFGSRDEVLMRMMLITAASAVIAGVIVCLIAEEITHRHISRSSRYTYLDIQQKAVVYSRYADEYRIQGQKCIFREIYLIPFRDFASAETAENGRKLIITGKIRHFRTYSDSLGYHVRDGEIVFDRWWLNYGGFDETEHLMLNDCFGRPEAICGALKKAKERFDAIPPPKKYEFHEADFIRRRPKPRLMPETLNYKREWK